jgi:hypothetical protein
MMALFVKGFWGHGMAWVGFNFRIVMVLMVL